MKISWVDRRIAVAAWAILSFSEAVPADPPGYTIRTIAGSDLVGDGGPAIGAFVSILEGVCSDRAGNIYVADADDSRIRKIDTSGIITTYAGSGSQGFGGDGGSATEAFLRSPYGVKTDAAGNLFIADLGNGRIRKVTPDGHISTYASGLNQPRNLAMDPNGALYVSEFGAHRVSRVATDGALTVVAGNGTAGFSGDGGNALAAQLNNPAGIAFDALGTLFIADSLNSRIRKVTGDGTISTFLGGVTVASGSNFPIDLPTGIATDSGGNVYVANLGYPAIFKVDTQGARYTLPGVGRDLFMSSSGDLLLVGQQHLEKIHLDGSVTTLFSTSSYTFGDAGPAVNARFESVAGVAVDNRGSIVIADLAFHRLRVVATNGTIESLSASDYITQPRAIAFNSRGQLFVADGSSIKLANPTGPSTEFIGNLDAPQALAFDAAGTLSYVDGDQVFAADSAGASHPVALSTPLSSPAGIASDSRGGVYVSDTANHAIRKIAFDGSVATVAGVGSPGFSGDGGPAVQAQLNSPAGLAFDSTGNLWIADTGNNRIRYVDPSGVIHTAAGTGIPGFSGDGDSAQYAQLASPRGLACDLKGNIFIADGGNRRVRELSAGAGKSGDTASVITLTHAATFKIGPVAGGEIITIFGQNLGPQAGLAAVLDSTGKLATQRGDVRVLVDGVPAPLYFVQSNQINAQIPVESAGRLSVLVEVQSGGITRESAVSDIAPYSPGLFAVNGFAAALNQDLSLNTAGNPAAPGSVIVLFGTGFGATQPLEVTGTPSGLPLAIPLAAVSVSIGGRLAQKLYAGDAPNFIGLTQINAYVPASTPPGQAEVVVTTADVSSPAGVYIHVR